MTSPPDERPGGLGLFIKIFGPFILGGLVLWAACIGLAYAALPQDGRLGLAVVFGSLFPFAGFYTWKAIGWWQGKPLPRDADQRRWTAAPTWSDFSRPATDDGDDVRRAACAEAIFGVLLALGPFALFALDGRVDDVVLVSVIGGAFAVSAILWITVVAWGRPRWLLPAEYRRPDRYVKAYSVVNVHPRRKSSAKSKRHK